MDRFLPAAEGGCLETGWKGYTLRGCMKIEGRLDGSPTTTPAHPPQPPPRHQQTRRSLLSPLCSDPQMELVPGGQDLPYFTVCSQTQWVYPSCSVETTSPPFGGCSSLGAQVEGLEMGAWYQGKSRGFQIRKIPNPPLLLGNFWHTA